MKNMKTQDYNTEPFFFKGGPKGIVLVHGFLTSPNEMQALGQYLASKNMTVLSVRLSGHGTQPEDLKGITWQDWVADVRRGLETLRRYCDSVNIGGLSLGGALSLYTAAHEQVDRVVAFSTPDSKLVNRPPVSLARPISHYLDSFPKYGSDVRYDVARHRHFTYSRIPLESVVQMVDFLDALETVLPNVTAPTLLVYAAKDRMVPPSVAGRIAQQLGGPVEIRRLKRGGHSVVIDYDRHTAFAATWHWLSKSGYA